MRMLLDFFISRVKSFFHAFSGIGDILSTEHNAWIHAVFTIVSLSLSVWLRIHFTEFVLIVIVITLVWVAEAFNTVLEIVVDMVSPRYSKAAKRAKDIAAGAVLFASIGAAAVGFFVFAPPLMAKFGWA